MTAIPDGGHAEVEWGVRFSGMEMAEKVYGYKDAQESARAHVATGSEIPGRVATLVAREVTYGPWVEVSADGPVPVPERAGLPATRPDTGGISR